MNQRYTEYTITTMDPGTTANGLVEYVKDRENLLSRQGLSTMVISWTISAPVKALSLTRMDLVMMETGLKIRGRARANTDFLILEAYIKGRSRMTSFMDQANWLGLQGLLTKATGRMANSRAMVCSYMLMEAASIQASGKKTWGMERAKWRGGKTSARLSHTMVNGWTIRSMVTVLTRGLMEQTT